MQTFLPYPSFTLSAIVLDQRRLNKQVIECNQILKALSPDSMSGWKHHPAILMWRGYEEALKEFCNCCMYEWKRLGYKRQAAPHVLGEVILPPWFGQPEFHAAHRSNLLRKDGEYYGQFGWIEPNNLPYVWPVRKQCNQSTLCSSPT